VTNENHLAY